MPSAFEPYLSKAIPLVNGIIDLGLALIKESIDFSLIPQDYSDHYYMI